MNNIFFMLIHLGLGVEGSDKEFEMRLHDFKTELACLDDLGIKASVTVIAKTADLSYEIAIIAKSDDRSFLRQIEECAEDYRGVFPIYGQKRA